MTADEVKQQLEAVGLVPVLRASSIPEAHALVEAILAGGVTVLEVTMTVPNARAPEVQVSPPEDPARARGVR